MVWGFFGGLLFLQVVVVGLGGGLWVFLADLYKSAGDVSG